MVCVFDLRLRPPPWSENWDLVVVDPVLLFARLFCILVRDGVRVGVPIGGGGVALLDDRA